MQASGRCDMHLPEVSLRVSLRPELENGRLVWLVGVALGWACATGGQ